MKENILKKDKKLIVGSRKSELAVWQSNFVKNEIEKSSPDVEVVIQHITTKGDKILDVALSKIGDKGLFTKELEIELLNGNIDIAVHSLKDLETNIPEDLKIGAVTKRHRVEDVLIAKTPGTTIDSLPSGATVATGSLRRRSQLKNIRPDINIVEIRGNVPTRIFKFLDSDWDGLILACAGVERLKMDQYISSYIPLEQMLPAVGQGALGIEISKANRFAQELVQKIHDQNTFLAVSAERALLRTLEGGCQVPIGAYAETRESELFLTAMVGSLNGKTAYRMDISGDKNQPERLGKTLAEHLMAAGASEILDEILKDVRKQD